MMSKTAPSLLKRHNPLASAEYEREILLLLVIVLLLLAVSLTSLGSPDILPRCPITR